MIVLTSGAVVVFILLLAASIYRIRRPAPIRQRTDMHEALLALMTDLCTDPSIVALLAKRKRMTRGALVRILHLAGTLTETELRRQLAELLSDRIVRRQVAKFLGQRGADRTQVLRELGDLLEARA